MKNTVMAEQLGNALNLPLKKDPITGGLKPVSEHEEKRIAEMRKHFTPRTPEILNPHLVSEITVLHEPEPVELEDDSENEVQEEPHNPFEGYLKGIQGHVLDAKNSIVFALEHSRNRLKERKEVFKALGDEIAQIELSIESDQLKLKQIEETLASVNLLAEQGQVISHLLPAKTYKNTSEVKKYQKPASDDPTICRRADIMGFFNSNRGQNWSIPEIIEHMGSLKREHAKKSLPAALAALVNEGKLARVSFGVYRLE